MKQEIVETGEPSDYRALKRQLQADIDYRLLGQHMQAVRQSRKMTQSAVAEKMRIGVKVLLLDRIWKGEDQPLPSYPVHLYHGHISGSFACRMSFGLPAKLYLSG